MLVDTNHKHYFVHYTIVTLFRILDTSDQFYLEMSAKRVGRITDDQDKSQFVREQSFWRLNQ